MTRRRLPAMSADEVIRALERAGFGVHRIRDTAQRNPWCHAAKRMLQ
jgi:hypothetical protein